MNVLPCEREAPISWLPLFDELQCIHFGMNTLQLGVWAQPFPNTGFMLQPIRTESKGSEGQATDLNGVKTGTIGYQTMGRQISHSP